MKTTEYLTKGYSDERERQIKLTCVGMASWADEGPFGTVCSECKHWGYHRQHRNASGDLVKSTFRNGCCALFRLLSGSHGPPVPANTASCRHFQRREE
jgi:hypothetical protein